MTGEGVNARTRVHEYGGGSYVLAGDALVFSDFADQRLYRQDPGSAPRPITPEPPAPAAHRYADACPTPDGRLLVCVRERHHDGEVVNELVAVPADGGGEPVVLAAGRDFYASPRVSPDGRRLAWLEWDHPNMPWDGTELRLAELAGDGLAGEPVTVAGGPEESVVQPEWSPDGVLHLVSDRTGWWNLYRVGAGGRDGAWQALAPAEEEFGAPHWVFGMSTYAFLPGGPDRLRPRPRPHAAPGRARAGRHPDRPGPALHLLLPAAPAGGRRPGGLHRRQPDQPPRRWS